MRLSDLGNNTLLPNPCPECGPLDGEQAPCVPVNEKTSDLAAVTPSGENERLIQ
jgi:hypothetical protein